MRDTPSSGRAEKAPEITPVPGMCRYLIWFAAAFLLSAAIFLLSLTSRFGGAGQDVFAQITMDGNADWYRNAGGRYIRQIQDQDIFYSNVGHSVASARASDIVFLGPSFVNAAIDRETLRSSPLLRQLKIYNMAFGGIRGGEFSRRIIDRWGIRVPLWVINADDQFVHFFSDDLNLTIRSAKTPIAAAGRSRIRGYLTVVGRNLRWRFEDWIAAWQAGQLSPSGRFGVYRNVSNGDMMLDTNPIYVATNNKPMRLERDPDCHTNPSVIEYARNFLREIGGNVVLMLVPQSQLCVRQAVELASALNIELIAPPPFDGLTSTDGGGHLDKWGAEKFTSYLAAKLVETAAFKRAFGGKLRNLEQGASAAPPG